MGTSSSHKGIKPAAGNKVDVVNRPNELGSQPFRSFRINLGKFSHECDSQHLEKALGSYARTAKGGSLAAFAPVVSSAASAISEYLSQNTSVETKNGKTVVSFINKLEGLSIDEAVEVIINELCPEAGVPGNELARQPVDEAFSKVLEIPEEISSAELIDSFLREYMSLVVFDALEFDFGESFNPDDADSAIRAEEQMKDYVHSAVESSFSSVIGDQDLSSTSVSEVRDLVSALIDEVLRSFDAGGIE